MKQSDRLRQSALDSHKDFASYKGLRRFKPLKKHARRVLRRSGKAVVREEIGEDR